jgi:hypothetical protein
MNPSCSSNASAITLTRMSRALLPPVFGTRLILIICLQGLAYDAIVTCRNRMCLPSLQAVCRQHKVRCERAMEHGPCVRCRRTGAPCVPEPIKVAESEINQCVHALSELGTLVYSPPPRRRLRAQDHILRSVYDQQRLLQTMFTNLSE